MSNNHPVKINRRPPIEREPETMDAPAPLAGRSGFVSFRYASAELSLRGGKAHVRSRRAQWEDGRLSTETFEGDLERAAYDRAIDQAQRYFAAQTAWFFDALAPLLPFSRKR